MSHIKILTVCVYNTDLPYNLPAFQLRTDGVKEEFFDLCKNQPCKPFNSTIKLAQVNMKEF